MSAEMAGITGKIVFLLKAYFVWKMRFNDYFLSNSIYFPAKIWNSQYQKMQALKVGWEVRLCSVGFPLNWGWNGFSETSGGALVLIFRWQQCWIIKVLFSQHCGRVWILQCLHIFCLLCLKVALNLYFMCKRMSLVWIYDKFFLHNSLG